MSRFSDQWHLFSNAYHNYNLDNIDHSGYTSYLEWYPLPYEAVIYIIENLKSRNSLLRKKLHECKQRNHSLRKKCVNKKDLYNEMLYYFLEHYTFEVLSQDTELCVEARGYLRCMIMFAEGKQLDQIYNYYDTISTYILGNKL